MAYLSCRIGRVEHQERPFMKDFDKIDMLKLRAGYGETSNQAINAYATLGLLSTRPYNFGNDNYSTGYYVSQLPNTNLGWEFSETWNFGLDFSFFKGRLSGTVEYYRTRTKDLLLSVGLPSTSGVWSSYMANIGETQNNGLGIFAERHYSGQPKWMDLGGRCEHLCQS
jgi:outer membrane receptor protein involved in Fe transport